MTVNSVTGGVVGSGVDSGRGPSDIRAEWKRAIRRWPRVSRVAQWLFDPAYASPRVLNRLLKGLPEQARVLNLGSGSTPLKRRAVNLDIEPFANVTVVGDGQCLPFRDATFDLVLLEYVLEHVQCNQEMCHEVHRVMKPQGYVYATAPFMQAYHGNPDDFYRYSRSGLRHLLRRFTEVECGPYGGPTSALCCMLKEYLAVLLSFGNERLYAVLSQLLILPLFPLKYIDVLLSSSANAHNISFSFYYVGQKGKQ